MFWKAFKNARFKSACDKCRLLYYRNPVEEDSLESEY